jgi:hypothetical protein
MPIMPIILATWEMEIKRIAVGGQPQQKVLETPSQSIARYTLVSSSYMGGLALEDPVPG